MKKQKKIIISIILFLIILLSNCQVFATSILDYAKEIEYSERYLQYLELEDKENVLVPRLYDIPKTQITVTNPIKAAVMSRTSYSSKYSLKTIIPENMVTKNQQDTGTCYAFASLAALESTLALKDYKLGNTPVVYDFSERHMEYATSKTFTDGINTKGHNREVGDGGTIGIPTAYLTNGTGAIEESAMPFENNENKISLSSIQNKKVVTQVNDTRDFASYDSTKDTTVIKQQMKEHIMNYGAIDAGIHGASILNNCYNIETGAIYCSDSEQYPVNHAVIIVGWDDNYSVENFQEGNRPKNNGAWIIRNSWGTEYRLTLEQMKMIVYYNFKGTEYDEGWTSEADVQDDFAKYIFEQLGFTIENNEAVVQLGENGFMYISYEDVNIYSDLTGIIDAQTEIDYENIYQYDYYGSFLPLPFSVSKIYLATVFDKATTGVEYLTQVGINAAEQYTCKVYVNPNGTSTAKKDLQQIQLQAGEAETFGAGYHTLEFKEPLKITGNNFAVVLEIQGAQTNEINIMSEFNFGEYFSEEMYSGSPLHFYDNVTMSNGKCFITTEDGFNQNGWEETSIFGELTGGNYPNFDTTIKAFTTSKILEGIEISSPPTKTSYIVGQDFDKTGMVVKAKYANGTSEIITNYTITNGTKLAKGQTNVIISYQGKTATQAIKVEENSLKSITVKTPPTKIEYFAGEEFEKKGMEIEANFVDGTKKLVTDYTIIDGETLKQGQKSVTISYQGKTVSQQITVKANSVLKIEIIENAKKLNYVVGQNFDSTGMKVKATYENGLEKEIKNYTIKDGKNLKEGQKTVTIEFEGKTATQSITVVAKSITEIKIKTMPKKIEYLQNKEELDLTGGVIEISYNDGTKEYIQMTSNEIEVTGFDNKEIGTKTIKLTYKGKTTQFNVNVKEEPKPENSNFDNMKGNLTQIKAYYFTDKTKEEYIVLNIETSDIVKSTVNDNMEYYYYLSSSKQENNITDWVKLNSVDNTGDKLSFEINTLDITNYDEIANAENVYLYIKEVAIRNDMKAEKVTLPILLEVGELKIEEYVDGKKKTEVDPDDKIDSTPGEGPDDTKAPGTIPNAGKNMIIVCLMVVAFIVGKVSYKKYRDIQIK